MPKNIIIVLFSILMLVACKQKALEPSYLQIDNFVVFTDPLTQGTSSQNLTEAIIYIDDQIAGVYHLPASIPIAISGTHHITVAPAVVENAIASNPRYAYTYLTAFDTTINLVANVGNALKPHVTYRSNVKFKLIEDFENPLPLFGKTIYNTQDTLIRDSLLMDNLEVGHCALFDMVNGALMEYSTRNKYTLPSSSESATFIEINYKSELPLAIGLYIDEPTTIIKTGVVTLNPKDTWSKAYINITNDVSVKPLGTKFSLFVSSLNASGVNKKVFIDNIKIIHFE